MKNTNKKNNKRTTKTTKETKKTENKKQKTTEILGLKIKKTTLKEIKKIIEEKKIKIILITGTPGTGKTTLAKKIKTTLKNYEVKIYNVKKEAEKQNLIEGYDEKRKSKIIDEKKIDSLLKKIIKEEEKTVKKENKTTEKKQTTKTTKENKTKKQTKDNNKQSNKTQDKKIKQKIIILEGHLSHYAKPKKEYLTIITTTKLKKLKERLKKRKYSKTKIEENLQSEIFKIILLETIENKHKNIILYEN